MTDQQVAHKLTEEEQEALKAAIWDYTTSDDDADCARMVAALHGILERFA